MSSSRCAIVAASKSVAVITCRSGLKVTRVPVLRVLPVFASAAVFLPRANRCFHALPSRQTSTSSHSDSALVTETPTPCRPPEILYPPPPNFPPACKVVSTTSTAGGRSWGSDQPECRRRCQSRWHCRPCGARRRSACTGRRAPHRQSCRPPHRGGGAAHPARCCQCTSPGACEHPPAPPEPESVLRCRASEPGLSPCWRL